MGNRSSETSCERAIAKQNHGDDSRTIYLIQSKHVACFIALSSLSRARRKRVHAPLPPLQKALLGKSLPALLST